MSEHTQTGRRDPLGQVKQIVLGIGVMPEFRFRPGGSSGAGWRVDNSAL